MMLGLILQAGATAAPQNMGTMNLVMILLIFVVFYFFMIRPQMKRQKEIKKFRESLKAGDKIITAGGIYGKIREMNDQKVVVEIAENVKVTLDKGSVFATAADTQQK